MACCKPYLAPMHVMLLRVAGCQRPQRRLLPSLCTHRSVHLITRTSRHNGEPPRASPCRCRVAARRSPGRLRMAMVLPDAALAAGAARPEAWQRHHQRPGPCTAPAFLPALLEMGADASTAGAVAYQRCSKSPLGRRRRLSAALD